MRLRICLLPYQADARPRDKSSIRGVRELAEPVLVVDDETAPCAAELNAGNPAQIVCLRFAFLPGEVARGLPFANQLETILRLSRSFAGHDQERARKGQSYQRCHSPPNRRRRLRQPAARAREIVRMARSTA